jgi:hypothetical protein
MSTSLNKDGTEMLTLSKHISSNYVVEITDSEDMSCTSEKCSCLITHIETQKQDSVTELLSCGVSVSDQ